MSGHPSPEELDAAYLPAPESALDEGTPEAKSSSFDLESDREAHLRIPRACIAVGNRRSQINRVTVSRYIARYVGADAPATVPAG